MQSRAEKPAARTAGLAGARQCYPFRPGGIGVSLPGIIPFVKASACGNDFLLIDSSVIDAHLAEADQVPGRIAELTRRLCNRHEGVGADGVEWMYPHATADVEIRLSN